MRDWRGEIRRRLAGVRLPPGKAVEIVDEIAQHLDDREHDLRARGKTEAEIETALLAELDSQEALARGLEAVGAAPEALMPGAQPGVFIADLFRDVRYAFRALLQSPGFTTVTLLSLALGIGANTAIFQLVDALQLRSLPVDGAEHLASIKIHDRNWSSGDFTGNHPDITNPIFERLRDQQQAFTGVFAFSERAFNLAPSGEANWARTLITSGDFFRILGVKPALGRFYTAADDQRGCSDPGVVLGNGFWQRELGGDPNVVGRELSLENHPVHVIGVAPAGFVGLEVGRSFDLAIPICMEGLIMGKFSYLDMRYGWWLAVMGRLKPGWTVEKANAHIAAISKGIIEDTVPESYSEDFKKKYLEYKLEAVPASTGISYLRHEYTTPLYFLLATAGLVLLIACANLANLLLARASAREREIAVRLAIGASRGRLVRQLMTESLLLAVVGAGLGLLLAHFLADFLVTFLSTERHRIVIDIQPDWRVLGFAIGLAVVTCLLFGLVPALRASRTDVGLVLKGPATTSSKEKFGLRRTLVTVQVALSFVLLVGALLFARTLGNLAAVDPGFAEDGVVILSADWRPMKLPAERRRPATRELLAAIRATPGVAAAASVSVVPVSGNGWDNYVWLDGKTNVDLDANFDRVSSGYFAAMQTRMVAGRDFTDRDDLAAPLVTIINQVLAEKLDPGGNPIGKHMRMSGTPGGEPEKVFEIIGVVGNSKYRDLREDFTPIAYFPDGQDGPPPITQYLVRGAGPFVGVVPALKKTVSDFSPALVMDFELLDRQLASSVKREKLMAALAGFFGVLAAVLATIGLYGVISYSVARRTHEIGIRMALGADARRVSRMIVGEAARLLGVGLAAGVVLALIGGRAAAAMLYGLAPHDPLTFGVALLLMTGIAFFASYLPARRAARVHPMSALREE